MSGISKRVRDSNVRKGDLYGNCEAYSMDGDLLFRCIPKKANWYLNKIDSTTGVPLAIDISDDNDDCLKIQFTFKHKGEGNKDDLYHLAKKENKCVVCGGNEDMTRHHVVPYEYRKFLPEIYKSRNSHDIVPICVKHHYEYERRFADKLKLKLSEKYEAPLSGDVYTNKELNRAISAARALDKHGPKIPLNRVFKLQDIIERYFQVDHIEGHHLKQLIEFDYDVAECIEKHGSMIVDKITNIQEFVEMWRQHFLDSMNPGFMPEYWSVKRSAKKPE